MIVPRTPPWPVNRMQQKSSLTSTSQRAFLLPAEDGSRTHKVFLPHGPEPCASANSATSAFVASNFSCATKIIIIDNPSFVNLYFKKYLSKFSCFRPHKPNSGLSRSPSPYKAPSRSAGSADQYPPADLCSAQSRCWRTESPYAPSCGTPHAAGPETAAR